ncbi:hypothetical protein ACMXYO_06930 [Neptuniibacter sp. QD37_6]|uniref:hypothetical protein n=1 Tax=Neptuniibacter sp. QD37_6 TaxID=3398210 RepID=UPI0039F62AFD
MEELVAIAAIFVILVLFVNIKVTRVIARSVGSTKNERVLSYLVVWFIPLVGVLLVPKKILPSLHTKADSTCSSGGSDGGCSGGDCG